MMMMMRRRRRGRGGGRGGGAGGGGGGGFQSLQGRSKEEMMGVKETYDTSKRALCYL
jgi:hypothetical protein